MPHASSATPADACAERVLQPTNQHNFVSGYALDCDTGTVSMLVVKSDKKKKKHYERVEALRTFADACDLPDVSHACVRPLCSVCSVMLAPALGHTCQTASRNHACGCTHTTVKWLHAFVHP
jgi:hypothetical protein